MTIDTGLLILRLVVGLGIIAHGTQKAFGWWGGGGPQGTVHYMRHLRFRPPALWALGAMAAEAGGGTLLAAGLLSPLGSVGVGTSMLLAISVDWHKGFFQQNVGIETAVLYLTGASVVGVMGPGRYSLDGWLRVALPEPITGLLVSVAAVVGVGLALASRMRLDAPSRQA